MQAAANAKENLNLSKLNLYVSECYADAGPNLKRFTNGYKGRWAPGCCRLNCFGCLCCLEMFL